MGDKNVRKKKPPKYPSWIGALTAFLAASALLTAGACAGIYWLLDATFGRTPQEEATLTAVASLTDLHGDEARAAIEAYYAISSSLYTRLHPEAAAQVATGPHLDALLEFSTPDPDDLIYVGDRIALGNVYVLEYTASRLKVVACGVRFANMMNIEGEIMATVRPTQYPFGVLYMFLQEDQTWKLATIFGLDDDNLRYGFPYMSEWERDAIGDAQRLIWTYSGCGIGR